ncbi:MAG TPA: Hint domain-containing protein [Candidatus Limnocylindria bacterium]
MRALLATLTLLLSACAAPAVLSSPTPAPSPLPVVELRYRIFDQVGRPWYCDSDFFPIARADEKDLARQRLPEMQRDADTYAAILRHNSLSAGTTLTDDQLLAVYHDWKDLQRLPLDPTGPAGVYGSTFVMRPQTSSKSSGERVELRIDTAGRITVLSRTQAGPPNCPICLSDATLIDTPSGPVRVTEIRVGDVVWTADASGQRVAAPVLEVGSTVAPPGHAVVRVRLSDGRTVTASPGHPPADGRALGMFSVGDRLDGAAVVAIERLPYRGRTYDLLPAGATGAYWADGVLLLSTLRR